MSIHRCLGVLGVLGVFVFVARPGQAADWTDRRFVIEGVTGFGTPVGLLGVLGRVDVIPWGSIGGGVGTSLSGVEYAGTLLGRIPFKTRGRTLGALTLGTSYSVGGSHDFDPNPSCWIEDCRSYWVHSRYHLANAHWVSLELGAEGRLDNGLSVRGFGGVAKLTNASSAACENYDRNRQEWFAGQCEVPLGDAGHSHDTLLPDLSGPSGMPDVIWVLGTAIGYAF